MKHSLTIQTIPITGCRQYSISTKISQSPKKKHICPCCSNALLRHVRCGGVYWRCSYCYQEMPV